MTKSTASQIPFGGYNAAQEILTGTQNSAIGITSHSARHSPLPFGKPMLEDESGVYVIRDANRMITARTYSAADAAFVRRACNSHEALLAALKKSKRAHYYCQDCWYTCPKHPDGCCDENAGDECNCGADEWNAETDAVIAAAEAQ